MKKILRILKNIVVNDERQRLIEFSEKHPNLNPYEKKIIDVTVDKLNNPKVSQAREIRGVIHSLRKLSLNGNLSKDGKILLTKLQRRQWIMILPYTAPFS